jgi:DnaD/phage-associated family protein
MSPFAGFPSGKVRFTSIPAPFFSELLPEIDQLGELKVTLYALWFLDQQEGQARYVAYQDFTSDRRLMKGLGTTSEAASEELTNALERACQRGTLIRALVEGQDPEKALYFLNSPRGRAAVKAWQQGKWSPDQAEHLPAALAVERPNIFGLYEQNIGPLTPMIAETLQQAEQEFPAGWIEDALRIAVENNVRRWRYVDAILRSWKEKGRHAPDRRNSEEDRRRYIEGEFADFIEH